MVKSGPFLFGLFVKNLHTAYGLVRQPSVQYTDSRHVVIILLYKVVNQSIHWFAQNAQRYLKKQCLFGFRPKVAQLAHNSVPPTHFSGVSLAGSW